jgi:hypothetical protein
MKFTFKTGLTIFILGIVSFGLALLARLIQWTSIKPFVFVGIALIFIGAVIMFSKLKDHPKFKAFLDS